MLTCWEVQKGVLLLSALDLSRASELAVTKSEEELKGVLGLPVPDEANDGAATD
jgi:hypothetical protein